MLCPSCASENPASNGYCGSCGTVLNEAAVVVPQYGNRKGLIKREIAILFGGIVALLGASFLAWYFMVSTRSPTRVVESFINADKSGQFTREQQLIVDTWPNRLALSLFQSVRQQSGSSPFQSYRVVHTTEDRSGSAYVDVELTLPQPTIPLIPPATPPLPGTPPPPNVKMVVTFILIRSGDDWKIDSGQTLTSVVSALVAQGFQQFQLKMPAFPNIPLPPGWPNMGIPGVPPGATPTPGGAPNTPAPSSMDGSI